MTHPLTCPTGGFRTIIRNNEVHVRDWLANLLTELLKNVAIKPHLQPLSVEVLSNRTASTEEDARLDVAANGFWGERFEKKFLDIRIFNLLALLTKVPKWLKLVYRRHIQEKQLKYEEKVREVEHASFVSFVLSCTGGAGSGATGTMKRLAAIAGRKVSITLQFHHSICPLPPQSASLY